jgi:hypothetical protein
VRQLSDGLRSFGWPILRREAARKADLTLFAIPWGLSNTELKEAFGAFLEEYRPKEEAFTPKETRGKSMPDRILEDLKALEAYRLQNQGHDLDFRGLIAEKRAQQKALKRAQEVINGFPWVLFPEESRPKMVEARSWVLSL